MKSARIWTATVYISEPGDLSTRAEVRLTTADGLEVCGFGRALHNPCDVGVPEIGDEQAVARALADLSQRLIRANIPAIDGTASAANLAS